MKKIKVGIIGCGGIANWKHMPNLKRLENVELVAFCDLILDRAKKAKEEFGTPDAKVFKNYKSLLAIDEIDVVHVLTPNVAHAKITIAALNAGKHVMCEKPMAGTVKDARAMLQAAKQSGKKLSIGYQTRSMPEYQHARDIVKSGALGEIYYVKAPAIRRRGAPCWGVFLDIEQQGGGPMIDIGTHSIDAAMFIMNNYDVESVTGSVYKKLADTAMGTNEMGTWTPEQFTVEDSAMGFVKFRNGCTMIIEASWLLNTVESNVLTICGTKGGLDMRDGVRVNGERDGKLFVDTIKCDSSMRELFKDENLNAEQYDMKQWIHSVENDVQPLVKPEEALVVSEIIEAIYNSAKTGKTIYFPKKQ